MSRPHPPCHECGTHTSPVRETRISNPWGWLCLVAGVVLLLLGLCVWPVTLLSAVLVVLGSSLRQAVVLCRECGHILHTGPTRLGRPSGRLLGVMGTLLLLNLLVGLFAAVVMYHKYLAMLNQF